MPIDDRTSTQNYPKPNIANTLADDVGRLRTALDDIDEDIAAKAPTASPTFTGTPAAPTAAADTNTTQVATTAYVVGQAGSTNPVMNGTATVGTSLRFSRQDHVHPSDTSRATSTHVHGNITNAGAIGSTTNLPIITTTSGVLTTGSFGTAANTFCQGNDARLSDTRLTTNSVTFNNAGSGGASGSTFNGSAALTVSYNTLGAAASNQGMFIGTTSVAINRASANLALTGISSIALPGATSGNVTLQPTATAGTTTITLPATTGTVVTSGDTGTVSTTMLANDAVTYAKIQNVSATDRLLGRSTAGAGDVEEITCTAAGRNLLDDADAAAQRTTLGLGTLATQSGTFSGTSSGTNTGDQTITLTGDVTGTGTGSFTTAIAAGVIVDTDVNASAAIAGTKISPNFGSQNVVTTGTSTAASLIPTGSSVPTNGVYLPAANSVGISTNGTGRLFVASDGRVLHNHNGAVATNPFSASHVPRLITTSTETTNYQGLGSIAYNGSFAGLWLARSASATVNGVDALTSGNDIGDITFAGADGTAFINAARIRCIVDGAVSTNTVPGALLFATSSTGLATERMRLDSSGRLGLGTSAPAALLHLSSATGSATPVPTELRIATTTNASDWSTTNPWGRISYFSADTSDSGPKIVSAIDAVSSATSGGAASLDFKFSDFPSGNLVSRFTILPNGRVGIGTTSPDALLTVNGIGAFGAGAVTTPSIAATGDLNTGFWFPAADTIAASTGGSERARIDSSGRLLVGTSSDSGGALLQVNGDRVRIATAKTPASASATGTAGEICWDADYIYVCTATDTWKRTAISTWP